MTPKEFKEITGMSVTEFTLKYRLDRDRVRRDIKAGYCSVINPVKIPEKPSTQDNSNIVYLPGAKEQ